VRVGSAGNPAGQAVTKYTFFRGLNGDRAAPAGGAKAVSVLGVPDERPFAGRVREQVTTLGVGGSGGVDHDDAVDVGGDGEQWLPFRVVYR